jgi:DNA topoisomerase-1
VDATGRPVGARRANAIDALAIPPAWTDVHIAASDRAAIQAWGYDARGRRQYRYHPNAVQRGERRKYYRMRQMAHDLPKIRRRVLADFGKRGLARERVLAGIVRLLAEGFFRVGSERYTKENHTFGITTLRKSHVRVDGDTIVFRFVGKRSIKHTRSVVSADLARLVTALLATPGSRLFRYQDDGQWFNVDARQVNEYIQSIAGFPYTAKDFRTWGGSLRAATVLAELGAARSERDAKKNVVTAMRLVSAELGNTPAICRQSYVHPVLIEKYVSDGAVIQWRRAVGNDARGKPWSYAPEERALVAFLDQYFPERRKRRRAA